MKAPAAPLPAPERVTPVTVGATASAAGPSTMKAASRAIAWVPRPSAAALPAASAIEPPFSASAEAPTPIPSGSVSPSATR